MSRLVLDRAARYGSWCRSRFLALFAVRRADIEGFAHELEARGRGRATVTRQLSTIAGFSRYAVEEELLDHSPAAHVRRPRLDYESDATALDRNELGAVDLAIGERAYGPRVPGPMRSAAGPAWRRRIVRRVVAACVAGAAR